MTFFEHIDALRPHLVRGVMAIGVIGLVAFFCKSFIIDTVLFGATKPGLPHQPHADMGGRPVGAYGRMAQQRARHVVRHRSGDLPHRQRPFLNHQHLAVRAVQPPHEDLAPDGLAMAMPYTLWEFWRFVRPALTPEGDSGNPPVRILGVALFLRRAAVRLFRHGAAVDQLLRQLPGQRVHHQHVRHQRLPEPPSSSSR